MSRCMSPPICRHMLAPHSTVLYAMAIQICVISVQCQSQPAFRCRLQIQIYFPLIANGSLGLVRTVVKDANDTDMGQQSVTWVSFENKEHASI